MKYTAVDHGHVVCERGASPTEFYVIMSGKFSVKVDVPGVKEAMVRRCGHSSMTAPLASFS